MVYSAQIDVPKQVKPGELFVVKITTEPEKDNKILVKSEPGKVQFMGAVQGSPDIQMRSETLVEIEPTDNKPRCYELKFIALGKTGESLFSVADYSGQRDLTIKFFAQEPSRNYSWMILAGGLVLLIFGIKLWRYQKSSLNMMSTKSLFMNYEELEKARKMYFGDNENSEETSEIPENVNTAKSKAFDNSVDDKPSTVDSVKKSPVNENKGSTTQRPSVAAPVQQQNKDDSGSTRQRNSINPEAIKPESATSPAKTETKNSKKGDLSIVIGEVSSDKTWKAQAKNIKIGRRRDNQIILTGSEISREHVEFFTDNEKIFLKPLSQSNITRLNGKDVKGKIEVYAGATLNLGGTDFIIKQATIK